MSIVQFTQEINPKIPSYNGYSSVRGLSDINMFVGIETDTKALIREGFKKIKKSGNFPNEGGPFQYRLFFPLFFYLFLNMV